MFLKPSEVAQEVHGVMGQGLRAVAFLNAGRSQVGSTWRCGPSSEGSMVLLSASESPSLSLMTLPSSSSGFGMKHNAVLPCIQEFVSVSGKQ